MSIRTLIFLLTLSFSSLVLAKTNVLVIHSYNSEHYWTNKLSMGVNDVFDDQNNIRVFHEYLDAKRFVSFEHKTHFLDYIAEKFQASPITAILVSDDAALNLIRSNRKNFFPSIPVIFMGINKVSEALMKEPGYTGVFENRDIADSVIEIKQLTHTDNIIILTDTSAPGLANLAKIEPIRNHPSAPKQIVIIKDLTTDEIVEKLSQYSPSTPIFQIGQLVNRVSHSLVSWEDGSEKLTSLIPNPLFTIGINTMEHGSVGTINLSARQHGRQAAELAIRILNGTPVDEIEEITKAELIWTFNWQLLKRYAIDKKMLPPRYELINRDEGFYEAHKTLVWAVIISFVVAALVIVLLLEVIRRGQQTRKILSENEERYKDLAHAGANIFWETDPEHKISYISGNTRQLTGKSSEYFKGKTLEQLIKYDSNVDFPWDESRIRLKALKPLNRMIFKAHIAKQGIKVLMLNGSPVFDEDQQFVGYRGICNDVTEEHHLSEKLAYQASFDSLTGLINRTSFNEKLQQQVSAPLTTSGASYVCFLDLDRFKLVNDTAGHLVGDAMLGRIASIIKNAISPSDILGRLGGDEFGLILLDKSKSEAQSICEAIIENIESYRYSWNDRKFSVGISIGMVELNPELSETELLSKADLSCYRAKELGRGRVYFASPDDKDLYDEKLQMGYIANVSQAIEHNQFFLVKQAIAKTDDKDNHHHYEILLRFKDENGQIVSPALFIPAAEKHGVISLIDKWVVTTVLTQYHDFFPDGETVVSINLSGLSLSNETFIRNLIEQIKRATVDPHLICFEITETATISNFSQALDFISQMKELGVQFALDDFGSGLSSFGYLKQLPVDFLKIDGSLIKNLETEASDRSIVKSINDIAHMMGMKTIAEFVENDEITEILNDIGVDYVQGYGIGKPEAC